MNNLSETKLFSLLFARLLCFSCSSSFVKSTFANKNVYKTKANLTVKKVYHLDRPTADQREFTVVPNVVPTVTKTTVTVTTTQTLPTAPSQTTTTTAVTTIPGTTTTTEVVAPAAPAAAKTTTASTTFSVPAALPSHNFIRYTVESEDENMKYIRVLPGAHFDVAPPSPQDTNIVFGSPAAGVVDIPSDYIFQVSKKALVPNTHYLAASALIGKTITVPVRVRNDYWDGNNKTLQTALSLGYAFGWKYKLGNNPYKSSYLSSIIYAVGVSQQKYFSIAGKYPATGKDSLSAKSDEVALTYLSFGLSYEYEKFSIGIFLGKDKMFGKLSNWAYQDRWWWGIGIGYDLFK